VKHDNTDVPITFFGGGEVAWLPFYNVTTFRGDILAPSDLKDQKFRYAITYSLCILKKRHSLTRMASTEINTGVPAAFSTCARIFDGSAERHGNYIGSYIVARAHDAGLACQWCPIPVN
jgi:hypothetical protein